MMITRALIADKIDTYHYKVRIPMYNKSESAVGSTPNNELYTACVSNTPGIIPAYNVGNAVYIGFESSDTSTPVILGALLNANAISIQNDINATSLTVSIDTHLSKDTTIGTVSPDNIATLEGQTIRIKNEFERVDAAYATVVDDIGSINNTIIYMQEHDEKADADAARVAARVATNESDIADNARDITNHRGDSTAHITADERTSWNNASNHTTQNGVHVTSAQKTNWNNHINNTSIHVTSSNTTAWNSHIKNTDIHITATERSNWNNKAPSSHTHTNFGTMILTENITYGKTLPTNPTKGQIFFLLESE